RMSRNDRRGSLPPHRVFWLISAVALSLLPLAPRRTCSSEAVLGGDEGKPEAQPATSAPADPAAAEFFEKSVRPILSARSHGCHGPCKQKGGLRLDARASILVGGSTGPAIVPGKPRESLLVDAINYGTTYQMPPKSKLPASEIATLTDWVKRGAPWGIE